MEVLLIKEDKIFVQYSVSEEESKILAFEKTNFELKFEHFKVKSLKMQLATSDKVYIMVNNKESDLELIYEVYYNEYWELK